MPSGGDWERQLWLPSSTLPLLIGWNFNSRCMSPRTRGSSCPFSNLLSEWKFHTRMHKLGRPGAPGGCHLLPPSPRLPVEQGVILEVGFCLLLRLLCSGAEVLFRRKGRMKTSPAVFKGLTLFRREDKEFQLNDVVWNNRDLGGEN